MESVKKIFCFIQSGSGTDFINVMAICEDGHVLANHLSSSKLWAMHDIGINSDWKHEKYKEHCPDGYEVVWLEADDIKEQMKNKDGEFYSAYLLNQQLK